MKIRNAVIGAMIILATVGLSVVCVTASANDAADPVDFVVGTSSIVLLPDRTRTAASMWVTGTAYSQGDYVSNTNWVPNRPQRIYFALNAGTSGATRPVHLNGDASDGAITWRRVVPGKRRGFVVELLSTGATVSVAVDKPAVINRGPTMINRGSSFGMDNDSIQGEIRGVSDITNAAVSAQEW